MTCTVCNEREATNATVIAGVYYPRLCNICKTRLLQPQSPSSGAADWARGRDAEDHEWDIQQPYSNGQINPGFIKAYPDKARSMFTPEELRKYG